MISNEIILRFNPSNPEAEPSRLNICEVYDKTKTLRYIDTHPDFYRITEDRQIIEIAKENYKLRTENKHLKEANMALLEVKQKVEDRNAGLTKLRYVMRTDSRTAFDLALEWFTNKFGELTMAEKTWLMLRV